MVGLALFVWIERRQMQPLMELGLFKNRTFSVTNGVGSILSFGMMGVFFLLPVFLQSILGYSVIKAGLVMTPLAAVVIFSSPTSGMLSDRIGPKWLMFAGMLVTAVGFFLTRRGHGGRRFVAEPGAALRRLGVRHRHGHAAQHLGGHGLGGHGESRGRLPGCSPRAPDRLGAGHRGHGRAAAEPGD